MSNKILKNFLIENTTVRATKTKGFTEKTMQLRKNGKSKISLADVKKLAEYFDEEADKKGGKYIIRARNIYRDNLTIRDSNGTYYDDDIDYFAKRNYDRKVYNEFFTIQIVYSK